MLRITTISTGDHQIDLLLEGRVAGPWVTELQRICETSLAEGRVLRLDLAGVSFLGADGAEVLNWLKSRGVLLVNCSPFVTELLKTVAAS